MAFNFQGVGPILEESVSSVTATPSRNLGDRVTVGGEEYVYAFNAGTGTLSKGFVAKLITGSSGYSVAATAQTDVFNLAVGVVKHADIAASSYGWLLVRGYASLTPVTALTSADAVVPLACGASGSVIQWAATGPTQGLAIAFAAGPNCSAGVSGLVAFVRTGY